VLQGLSSKDTVLDKKTWMDITTLHVAASYLDPFLKSFLVVKNGGIYLSRQYKLNAMHFNGILISDDSDTVLATLKI